LIQCHTKRDTFEKHKHKSLDAYRNDVKLDASVVMRPVGEKKPKTGTKTDESLGG
jgi:hypothetical protein